MSRVTTDVPHPARVFVAAFMIFAGGMFGAVLCVALTVAFVGWDIALLCAVPWWLLARMATAFGLLIATAAAISAWIETRQSRAVDHGVSG